ncbi:MAG TPA: F0F1 ATP synthase subunit delta [Thiobacillaceae bacterium]|nr:F0F1 ATP synthase subunit delta [Thiobacillaceae bacterium]
MAELSTLARPYAEAIFRLARNAGELTVWSGRLRSAVQVVADAQMRALISDPNVPAARVSDLLISVLGDSLGDKGANLISLLAKNHRLSLLAEIEVQFEALKAESEGKLEAHITSALAMSDAQVGELAAALKTKYGREVAVSVSIDPALIGGVVVAIGDRVMDGSVRGRLQKMAFSLKA